MFRKGGPTIRGDGDVLPRGGKSTFLVGCADRYCRAGAKCPAMANGCLFGVERGAGAYKVIYALAICALAARAISMICSMVIPKEAASASRSVSFCTLAFTLPGVRLAFTPISYEAAAS